MMSPINAQKLSDAGGILGWPGQAHNEPFFADNLAHYSELLQPPNVLPYQTYKDWKKSNRRVICKGGEPNGSQWQQFPDANPADQDYGDKPFFASNLGLYPHLLEPYQWYMGGRAEHSRFYQDLRGGWQPQQARRDGPAGNMFSVQRGVNTTDEPFFGSNVVYYPELPLPCNLSPYLSYGDWKQYIDPELEQWLNWNWQEWKGHMEQQQLERYEQKKWMMEHLWQQWQLKEQFKEQLREQLVEQTKQQLQEQMVDHLKKQPRDQWQQPQPQQLLGHFSDFGQAIHGNTNLGKSLPNNIFEERHGPAMQPVMGSKASLSSVHIACMLLAAHLIQQCQNPNENCMLTHFSELCKYFVMSNDVQKVLNSCGGRDIGTFKVPNVAPPMPRNVPRPPIQWLTTSPESGRKASPAANTSFRPHGIPHYGPRDESSPLCSD